MKVTDLGDWEPDAVAFTLTADGPFEVNARERLRGVLAAWHMEMSTSEWPVDFTSGVDFDQEGARGAAYWWADVRDESGGAIPRLIDDLEEFVRTEGLDGTELLVGTREVDL